MSRLPPILTAAEKKHLRQEYDEWLKLCPVHATVTQRVVSRPAFGDGKQGVIAHVCKFDFTRRRGAV